MISSDIPNYPRKVRFDWISESFQIFMRDAGTWILAVIIYGAIILVFSFSLQGIFMASGVSFYNPSTTLPAPSNPFAMFGPGYWTFLGFSSIIGWPLTAFFYGGLFRMANQSVRGEPISVGDVFSGGKTILPFMGFALIFGVLSYLGLLACIIGSFVVTALLFPAYALLADGEGIDSAIQKSFNGMKADWLTGAIFVFVFGLLYLFTCICILPIFATVPMALIIGSLAYRDMIGMPIGATVVSSAPTGSWPPTPTLFSSVFAPPFDTQVPAPEPSEPEKPSPAPVEPGNETNESTDEGSPQ